MVSSIFADARTNLVGAAATTNKSAQSVGSGPNFGDILISTNSAGGSTNAPATQRATGAAAGAAANDVDILAKMVGAFRNGAPDGALGVETIDRTGHVIAGASLDSNGDLSVYGSGSSGDASSAISMSLSSQGGGSWYANASSELAQASYELNALMTQTKTAAGVDRAS
jgi:hypothetical protein